MLINHSWYNFLEKIIFDFQITIDTAHPVQISSRSDNCVTTDIMWKSPKMPKKWSSLKNQTKTFGSPVSISLYKVLNQYLIENFDQMNSKNFTENINRIEY